MRQLLGSKQPAGSPLTTLFYYCREVSMQQGHCRPWTRNFADWAMCKLCAQGMGSELQRFAVGKRIASCLSAVSSQHTLDHLVYEISQLLHESDDPYILKAFAECTSRVSLLKCSFLVVWRI